MWCLSCGDRYAGRPAQVGDDHLHRDDAHHAARLHADDHEADFRRFVAAERTREAREKFGWTSRVYGLVAAATGEDPDGGVWWDGSGYRLVPAGARLGAKGRRVRRRVVELVIKPGFLQQDECGDVVATPDGRAMLKIWQHHRADLAEPWPARHEPDALPPLRKPLAAARPPASACWSWGSRPSKAGPSSFGVVMRPSSSTRPSWPPRASAAPTCSPSAPAPIGPAPERTST
ncbi:hypothetical protein [Kitasatospora sp. NPDC059327]|uniref:hypothetical protein n=1 Tax=Kitasatospora sp. NPDC059327 TaxID=3346803 RepID=UPI0036BC047B